MGISLCGVAFRYCRTWSIVRTVGVQFGLPMLLATLLRCCNRVVSDEVDGNLNQVAKMIGSGNLGGGGWHSGLSEAWARRRHRIAEHRRFWALVEPYRPPPRLMPLLLLNTVAFYTGLVAAAVTEQLYKEKYWDEHPGAAVPIMHPMFYIGPYKVTREDFSEENA